MWLALALVACGPGLSSRAVGDGDTDAPDTTAPVITHTPISGAVLFGQDVNIEATITDDESRILLVTLWFKQETQGSEDFSQRAMVGDADGVYRAVIPSGAQGSSGMDYTIEAVNASNLRSFAPSEGKSDPYHFRLTQ
jgi:hypothetical protein